MQRPLSAELLHIVATGLRKDERGSSPPEPSQATPSSSLAARNYAYEAGSQANNLLNQWMFDRPRGPGFARADQP